MDISDYNLKWLRSQISIVSQEPVLFAKSIKDNITYGLTMDDGKPVPQKLIEESARNANIHDFIMSLPLVGFAINSFSLIRTSIIRIFL